MREGKQQQLWNGCRKRDWMKQVLVLEPGEKEQGEMLEGQQYGKALEPMAVMSFKLEVP